MVAYSCGSAPPHRDGGCINRGAYLRQRVGAPAPAQLPARRLHPVAACIHPYNRISKPVRADLLLTYSRPTVRASCADSKALTAAAAAAGYPGLDPITDHFVDLGVGREAAAVGLLPA